MPKGQDQGGSLDRLRRRLDSYREHHHEAVPRFDNTVSHQNQQQKQETQLLRQRYLETNKAKKSAKKSEKKQNSESGGTPIGPSKSNKRQNEDDQKPEGYEPPSKIGGSGRGTSSSPLPSNSTNSSLYKQGFSQNGKRGGNKTKALDSQKYPSSSHPKNGIGRVPPIPPSTSNFPQCTTSQPITTPITEFKKESNAASLSDFTTDLAQCAAAMEKDATKNGAIMGSFLGENSTAVLKDLLLNLEDLNPEDMSDYLDGRQPHTADDLNDIATLHGSSGPSTNGTCNSNEPFLPVTPVTPTRTVAHGHLPVIKLEDGGSQHSLDRGLSHCAGPSPAPASTASPLASQLGSSSTHQPSPSQSSYNNSHYVLDSGQTGSPLNPSISSCNSGNAAVTKPSTRLPYPSPAGLSVDSPAAQTLKQMAEQHQHKAQMCITSNSSANGGVPYKSQGSPVGSPYANMGNYNGNISTEFSGPTSTMNPGSNCQMKQEVCSPVNPQQAGFSSTPMMDIPCSGGKRPGQHNGSSPSGQSSRIPNMSSTGGSPIMSPISKSFNHPSPLNASNSQQLQQPTTQQQPQQSQPPSYMPGMNRLPGPSQSYSNANPRFPNTNSNSQISVASPKGANHVNDRGSPATQIDTKPSFRLNTPNSNMQQPQQFPDQQFHYGNGQSGSAEMGFNPSGHPQTPQMQPQPQNQQAPPSGQTINFTQQHLRMGGQPGMHVSRMPISGMNRMGVSQRLPGGHISDMQQQRPMLDGNPYPQQRPQRHPQGQHTRHMIPPHQQMPMGGMQPSQAQINSGPGMGGQMMNRFPGMPNNAQMMGQQHQSFNMTGNMSMSGPGNMPMRRPYGPTSNFQGMNPRTPSDQTLSSGSQNPHSSMNNIGMQQHTEWIGNDGSCPPYSGGPQRHAPSQQMRPNMPPQQYHSGMPPNQAASVQGPPQLPGNFCQQLQQTSQQQLPPNSGHHSQQSMYGFGMKPTDGNMMCPPQNSMTHPQIQPHQQSQSQPSQQPQHNMYNMGNTNNMMNSGGNLNSNVIPVSEQQDFNFDMFVNGIRNEGDPVDTTAFNDDLLDNLDAVFP